MSLTVIKLGGSLMQSDELSHWLGEISLFAEKSNIVIVPGGGIFADSVRTKQSELGFNDVVAHRMALLAMAQYGYYLAGLNSNIQIIDDFDSIQTKQINRKPFLWLPMSLLDDFSEIPASWDYTSDSIALWLAIKTQAPNLVLVKSVSRDDATSNYFDNGFERLIEDYAGETQYLTKLQFKDLNN